MIEPTRFSSNPLISPADVQPSQDGLVILCAFNPGAFKYRGRYGLLLRVAEYPKPEDGWIATPIYNPATPDRYRILRVSKDDHDLKATDPRVFTYKGRDYLTSISHLRLAWSDDGEHFTVEPTPAMRPFAPWESFGLEDPRVVFIEGRYLITYTAVSAEWGICPAIATTTDWQHFDRRLLMPPSNKDVCIFPEKIGGKYVMRHRPMPCGLSQPSIWTSYSDDLEHWGNHTLVMNPQPGTWCDERVGAGAPPIRTERGWLEFYHGSNTKTIYKVAPMLSAIDDPTRILHRGDPLLVPKADYELKGFLGQVVFHNGLIADDDGTLRLYYGAADTVTCGAKIHVNDVLALMK